MGKIMRGQMMFEFVTDAYPGFDIFLGSTNDELRFQLDTTDDAMFYVWGGDAGARKGLLRSWVDDKKRIGCNAVYFDAESARYLEDPWAEKFNFYALEGVDDWGEDEKQLLFNLINRFRNDMGQLLFSAGKPPRELKTREDLRTRLAQSLVYELKPLDDEELGELFESMLDGAGIPMQEGLASYVLTHHTRDVSEIIDLAEHLKVATLLDAKGVSKSMVADYFGMKESHG